jgi:hypothetical protein
MPDGPDRNAATNRPAQARAGLRKAFGQPGAFPVAAYEHLGVRCSRRQRDVLGLRLPAQRRGLREHVVLQSLQLRARLHAHLVDEDGPDRPVRRQRVGLPAAPVERHDELAPEPFPQRMFLGQRLELGDDIEVPAGREFHVDAVLDGREAHLLKTGDLGLQGSLGGHVGQHAGPPQPQRLDEGGRRAIETARAGRLPCLPHQPGEPVGIDLVGIDVEDVARRPAHQPGVGRQHFAQARHVRARDGDRGWWSRFGPQCVHDGAGGNHFARA